MVYAMNEMVSFRVETERFTRMSSIRSGNICPVVGILLSHFRNRASRWRRAQDDFRSGAPKIEETRRSRGYFATMIRTKLPITKIDAARRAARDGDHVVVQ